MQLQNGYVGINNFGFGGSNAHVLLKWNDKLKINNGAPNDDLPRLVVLSGRTEESVKLFLNDVSVDFSKIFQYFYFEQLQILCFNIKIFIIIDC